MLAVQQIPTSGGAGIMPETPLEHADAVNDAAVSRCFDKAAADYVKAARLQMAVALDALTLLSPPAWQTLGHSATSGRLLDLGCGPGWVHHNLLNYCDELVALDFSAAMLAQARQQGVASQYLHADAAAVPLAGQSVDKVFSSLMLQWCAEPLAVLAEVRRLLKPGGRFVLTTLVEESLQEFSASWQQAGFASPQLAFAASDELIRLGRQAGLEVQAQQRSYLLFFPDVQSIAREFKQIGANAVRRPGAGLGGKERWARFARAYEQKRTTQGLPLTYQVLFLFGQCPADESVMQLAGSIK